MGKIAVSDAAMNHALITELCLGRQFVEEMKRKDAVAEMLAAQEAQAARGHKTINGLGRMVGTIPQADYFRITQAQGTEFWDDRASVRHYFKTNPDQKVSSI